MRQPDPSTFWNDHYAARPATGYPRPNARLTEVVSGLPMGDALELGCGNGGDALWLAQQGRQVTATDISAVAVSRLQSLARAHGLGDRISAVRHDLGQSFPSGSFDLVCALYLQTPYAWDRAAVLRRAALALNPGGRLLVVDHGSNAPWSWNPDPQATFPSPAEVAAGLDLHPDGWLVERAEALLRIASGPSGEKAEVTDHLLLIRRAG